MSPSSDPRATVTDMWQTRPTRRQSERKLAGVAAALARRYDIDPVLVRIGFVVAAFYGVGILVYLAAWIALPPDPVDPPRGAILASTASWVVVLILVAVTVIRGIHSLAGGNLDFLIGLLVVGALLYLLQTSRGEHGLARARAEAATAAASVGGTATGGATGPAPSGASSPSEPAGAGLAPPPGAAPSPEPARRPRKPRSRVTPVTIALALLAAGITGVVLLVDGAGLPGPRLLVGVMLAVVGFGLVVGSFVRGGRGLILLALPLLLVGWGVTRTPVQHWHGAGELLVRPTTAEQVSDGYERTFGRVELDLRRLDLAAPTVGSIAGAPPSALPAPPPTDPAASQPPDLSPVPAPAGPAAGLSPEPLRTTVSVQFGEAVVLVPPNADVRVRCHAAIGEVSCLGVPGVRSGDGFGPDGIERDGPTAHAEVNSLGADGVAGGRPLELDVTVGTGSVEVRRG